MAVKKDAAFYRKQRMDDEAKAKKGDKKAKAELSKIESKRAAARGKSTPKASPEEDSFTGSVGKSVKKMSSMTDAVNPEKIGERMGSAVARSAMNGRGGKTRANVSSDETFTGSVGRNLGRLFGGGDDSPKKSSSGSKMTTAQKPTKKKAAS